MVRYEASLTDVAPSHLEGFFVGWPVEVPGERLLAVLERSDHVVVAWDEEEVVGFVNALSDGVLSAFIPLLEVRPEHRGQGIGARLVESMLDQVGSLYSVDLVCDDAVVPFYERVGGRRLAGVGWRNPAALP